MTINENSKCRNMYLVLDCLALSDLVVELVLLMIISLPALVVVAYRIKRIYKKGIFTQEQLLSLKYSKLLYWHLLVYLLCFCFSLSIAVAIYILFRYYHQDLTQSARIQVLGKIFWLSLYGYVTLLNLIFTVITYIFLVKSRELRKKKQSTFQYYFFWSAWVLQILSFVSYIYLISTYEEDQSPDKFLILKVINLSQTILCTILLVYIFFVVYGKVRKASIITFTVKKQQTTTIQGLIFFHVMRVIAEVLNVVLVNKICQLRWNQEGASNFFSIYLIVAHLILNIFPVIFILYAFKPIKSQFHQSLITTSDVE